MPEPQDLLNVLVVLAVIGVFAYASVAMLDAAHTSDTSAQPVTKDDAVLLDAPGVWVDVGSELGNGQDETVRNTRNFSLRFTGAADSYLQSNAAFDIAAGTNWTVGTGVWVNDSATGAANMTVLAAGDPDVLIRYENASGTANWSAYIINQQTYVANVSAVDPTNATYLFVQREAANVTIYRYNATGSAVGETVNVTTGATTTAANLTASGNFNGRLDETRTFNESLSAAQRQAIANDPIVPLANATRTGRLMYDAGSGTAVRIYWSDTAATASNASYAAGYTGAVLERGSDPILGPPTGDYAWDDDGPELRPLDGGALDGAPVAFAVYDFRPFRYQFLVRILETYDLIPTIMLALLAAVAVAALRRITTNV